MVCQKSIAQPEPVEWKPSEIISTGRSCPGLYRRKDSERVDRLETSVEADHTERERPSDLEVSDAWWARQLARIAAGRAIVLDAGKD